MVIKIDWFTAIIFLIIGFAIGRVFPLYKKFLKFLDKEKDRKRKEEAYDNQIY